MSIDYFAELYVAGQFAAAGWNVYFPHRDQGFDFIVSRHDPEEGQLIRPVQVKGKYPEAGTPNRRVYGYIGKLSQRHPEMILAIPYFQHGDQNSPICIAYMPMKAVRAHSRGYRCQPALFKSGLPVPRREFLKFFDAPGLRATAELKWKNSRITGDEP